MCLYVLKTHAETEIIPFSARPDDTQVFIYEKGWFFDFLKTLHTGYVYIEKVRTHLSVICLIFR